MRVLEVAGAGHATLPSQAIIMPHLATAVCFHVQRSIRGHQGQLSVQLWAKPLQMKWDHFIAVA
jgi:hypothetical protein